MARTQGSTLVNENGVTAFTSITENDSHLHVKLVRFYAVFSPVRVLPSTHSALKEFSSSAKVDNGG
jgi:hypothetical protein